MSLLSKQTQKPDNFLTTAFENNKHGLSFPLFVGSRQPGCWANILIRTSRLCRNASFSQITYFGRLQTYMTANLLQWMYVTVSQKKIISRMSFYTFLVSISCLSHEIIVFYFGAILHKAELTVLTSVSILKPFVNGIYFPQIRFQWKLIAILSAKERLIDLLI